MGQPVYHQETQRIPELDRYQQHCPDDFSDAWYKSAPLLSSDVSSNSQYSSSYSAHSASPSTRFSESPRPGAYSRDTTPTSSPGLLPPFQAKPRMHPESPVFSRPPVTRSRLGSASEDAEGLSVVRESLASSSSGSTVKDIEKKAGAEKARRKMKRLETLPPTPPPRKSSTKFKSNPHSAESSPELPRGAVNRPVVGSRLTALGIAKDATEARTKVLPQNTPSPNSRIAIPPRRPSRDGTPDLAGLSDPTFVVQSNLAGVVISPETRPCASRLPAPKGATPLLSFENRREATPAPAPAGLGLFHTRSNDSTTSINRLRTPSPSIANSTTKHRFGLFSRREKSSEPTISTVEKNQKITRKGPAAGTGHEGYGRYAFGGRGRNNTLSSRDRSLSTASTTSQESFGSLTATHDPFFSARSSPVIIAGGGSIVENQNSSVDLSGTQSNQSLTSLVRPSLESKVSHGSSRSNLSHEVDYTLAPPQIRHHPAASSTSLASKAPDKSDNHHWNLNNSLAVRRSLLRLNKKEIHALNSPAPFKIPRAEDCDASSVGTLYDNPSPPSTRSVAPNKLTKRSTSPKRRHFFQRKKTQAEVATAAERDPIAYFAMDFDEEKKKITIDGLKEIMRTAEVPEFQDLEPRWSQQFGTLPPPKVYPEVVLSRHQRRPSHDLKPLFSLYPKIEEQKPLSPEPQQTQDMETPNMWKLGNIEMAPNRGRLQQVDLIRKVVPNPSPQSFSRPFRRGVAPETAPVLAVVDPVSIAKGPSPEKSPARSIERDTERDSQVSQKSQDKPFLFFPPRKNSIAGTMNSVSGSSGVVSSYEGTTAVVPKTEEPLNEDEIWDEEFEDLIPKTPVQESPLAQVNLRVGSMTVSKWLSFGHVLFSPARDALIDSEPNRHHSILVIDGLGNDDWSFYAAETYPDATFHNLSPTPTSVPSNNMPSKSAATDLRRPENHRQVQHLSLSVKFPFTPNTFSIVVLRFPTLSSDEQMRHLIAECKRVLKPSGYLEISILDLDMRDMGPKTRRAVRDLKIAVSLRHKEANLQSMSDMMLRLVGKRGFTSIKSCNVGVPVAMAVSSPSSSPDDGKDVAGEGGNRKSLKRELSLADLMKDPTAKGDEGITKMVAKVGRWWWSKCYEKDAQRSTFNDEKVVEEAEMWGTSFKLCVAYAQKGELIRRTTT